MTLNVSEQNNLRESYARRLGKRMISTPRYLSLGDAFFKRSTADVFSKPKLLLWNAELANAFALNSLSEDERANYFCGQAPEQEKLSNLAYAGHQFGHFNPSLGDGRAHLLGEIEDKQGFKWELQMKGSGPTAFSRGGDGLCALGPAVREYIMSEALHSLGIPSCRTLCVVSTGDTVIRREGTVPGAVVTRAAHSHIRIGSFQYFLARGDIANLKKLCEFTIDRHYPEILERDPELRYPALLEKFIARQIELICEWMRIGFIHGVMNTDNITLSGQTIDFGPCAMLEAYNPKQVFSSIDQNGRYSFAAQGDIAQWNTLRFAECLLPLIGDNQDQAVEALAPVMQLFQKRFTHAYSRMLHNKFGLNEINDQSSAFCKAFLGQMQKHQLDYTNTFRALVEHLSGKQSTLAPSLIDLLEQNKTLFTEFNHSLSDSANPKIIPRNHLVESAIKSVVVDSDVGPILALLEAVRSPSDQRTQTEAFTTPATDRDEYYQTFCGT